MSLDQFKASPVGVLVGRILTSEEMIRRMEAKSEFGPSRGGGGR